MSMGHGANFGEVIEVEDIKKVVPEAWERFEGVCEKFVKGGWQEVIRAVVQDEGTNNLESVNDEDRVLVDDAYNNLFTSFDKETGLELIANYHNCDDNGDCYDEVDGSFFTIEGKYQISPEYKKATEKFGFKTERKFWVTYG